MIKPQKASTRLLAFASDSESDDDSSKKPISIGVSSSQKRQARIVQENALKEDPTIFQYDEVYDDINTTREAAKTAKKSDTQKQSKYINRLLEAADKRKQEHENRIERQVQKEREAEGDKYKDKEVFVTASYRAKLEERKLQDEKDQREEYLENIGDVRKQGDLSGFYRHVYEQKLGSDKVEPKTTNEPEKTVPTKTKDEKIALNKKRSYRKHSDHENSDSDKERKEETSEKDDKSKKVHLQSNIDADSDFSIDSESDEDDKDAKPIVKIENVGEAKNEENAEKSKDAVESNNDSKQEQENKPLDEENVKKEKTEEMLPPPEPPKPKKPKIDVWKKRTVGDVYLAAVQRYYERKQQASA